jgi:transcriptional regulator GlxA family with amidase domain
MAENVRSASLRHHPSSGILARMVRRVAILAFDDGQPLDAVGPCEVFAAANQALTARGRTPAYEVEVVGLQARPLRGSSGLVMLPARSLDEVPLPLDTLIIAGGAGARAVAGHLGVQRAVRRSARGARRVASVCTGTFVLAAAGLLDGRRATTHWAHCAALADAFPRLRVERDPIFVRDGRLWTSAGVTAGIDLALAMVEADLGRETALLLARYLVMFVRRAGGQSQFSPVLAGQAAQRTPIRELQGWISEHPEAALDLPTLARRAAMSVRHFARVFRAEVGASPAAYVAGVRVDTARRLLESSTAPIEEVARSAGFGTPEALRRALGRGLGLSPREYRARFGNPHQERDDEDGIPAVRRPHGAGRGRPLRGAGASARRRGHLRRSRR